MDRPALAWTLAFALSPVASAGAAELWEVPDLRDSLNAIRSRAASLRVPSLWPPPAGADFSSVRRDPSRYPVRGIDVAHYQDDIDWEKVKRAGIAFAYIKATEGGDHVDPAFSRNWRDSSRAGMLRGAYHFYNFCKKGAEQARNFIRTVPAEAGALPPTVDLERSGSCSRMPRVSDLRRELSVLIEGLRWAYGKRPILYATREVYESYLRGWSDPDRLWMTSASGSPAFPDDAQWLIWQHTDRGRVDGIGYWVDMNVFSGTLEQLAFLAEPEPAAAYAQAPSSAD